MYEGKDSEKDQFRLVGSNAIKEGGVHAKYKQEDTKNVRGMRVKLTFTFSAMGCCAPLFIYVCGLTERELPEEESVIIELDGCSCWK